MQLVSATMAHDQLPLDAGLSVTMASDPLPLYAGRVDTGDADALRRSALKLIPDLATHTWRADRFYLGLEGLIAGFDHHSGVFALYKREKRRFTWYKVIVYLAAGVTLLLKTDG